MINEKQQQIYNLKCERRNTQLDNMAEVFRETSIQKDVIPKDSPRTFRGGNNLVVRSTAGLKTATISYNDPRKYTGSRIYSVRFN